MGCSHSGVGFPENMPSTFMLETVLACNLDCPDCAIGGGLIGRPKGILKYDDFLTVVEKIRPYARYVYLHIWGEPTMNKRIYDMISLVREFALVNISTNALLLNKEKCQKLIESGVSDLIVSIDGVTQEVYEQYRVGGDVKTALESLVYLNFFNRKAGYLVNTKPQFIVFRHNQHEAVIFKQFCESLGLKPEFKAPYLRGDSKFQKSDIEKLHRPTFSDVDELRKMMSTCDDPRSVMTILNDGSCVVCCHDYEGQTTFGNIFEKSVEDIWHSRDYAAYRGRVCSGDAPDFCVNECMTWTLDQPKQDSSLVQITVPSAVAP